MPNVDPTPAAMPSARPSSSRREAVRRAVAEACDAIAPTWPLDQLIAVNPLWPLTHLGLGEVAAVQGARAGVTLLPRTEHLRDAWRRGDVELSDLRALALPDGFDITSQPQCLNKHGLQTVTTGMLHLQLHTVVQQYQTPKPAARGAMGRPFSAKSMPQFQREKPGFGALKGAMMVGALARQPSAVDRVFKRLQERKRAEGTDDDDGAAAR